MNVYLLFVQNTSASLLNTYRDTKIFQKLVKDIKRELQDLPNLPIHIMEFCGGHKTF
ncbi:hypothetical protein [Thermocrinis minervae]|uniref:Uncharacterized protein n=1 Tax=Thermocrinis minervae TaxID=381751 RepID=A0A1M6S1K0_9AQUI|nr:hypothetical protein [Thermocrinis minervae]SHK38388.1 hypothetical protein SAMN05444391_0838 [Thermocrinis minervae]